MTGWLKIIAIVSPFLAVALGAVAWQEAADLARAAKALARASSSLSSASSALSATSASLHAAEGEAKIQTVTRTVYVKAAEGKAHVQQIDPKCSNGDSLVADFKHQLERMRRPAAPGGDPSAAVEPDPVHRP